MPIARNGTDEAIGAPSLQRGLAVLELLCRHPEGLRASDIAHCLEAPLNSTGRILKTLIDEGFLQRDAKNRSYKLTRKLLTLGSPAVGERLLVEQSLDVMKDLREKTDETVLLTTVPDDFGVVLEQVPSRNAVRLVIDPGTRFDLHSAAPGKVALAFKPQKEAERILKRLNLKRYTQHTITGRSAFRRELDEVRRLGYGTDRSECISGVHCVAAPIYNRHETEVAEITVTAPEGRIPIKSMPELAKLVMAGAREITRKLAGH